MKRWLQKIEFITILRFFPTINPWSLRILVNHGISQFIDGSLKLPNMCIIYIYIWNIIYEIYTINIIYIYIQLYIIYNIIYKSQKMDPQKLQLLFQKPSFSMHVARQKQQHFPEKAKTRKCFSQQTLIFWVPMFIALCRYNINKYIYIYLRWRPFGICCRMEEKTLFSCKVNILSPEWTEFVPKTPLTPTKDSCLIACVL